MNRVDKAQRRAANALAALQFFIGFMGVAGGVPMILDPSGAITGFEVEMLAASPFPDYLIPGIVLLVVNGLGSLVGGFIALRRHRSAGDLALALGAFLLAWIVVQIWWIGLVNWMQPFFLALAIAELSLGLLIRQARQRAASG